MEVSSGIEVIRRLLRIGLIEDYPDPHDRRSKRVRITTAGRQILTDLRPGMDNIGELVTGNLTEREKNQLARILQNLNTFGLLPSIRHKQFFSPTFCKIACKVARHVDLTVLNSTNLFLSLNLFVGCQECYFFLPSGVRSLK